MARRAGRRRLSVFSLSFLDVMSCGFGAVVLIFLIIHHRTEHEATAHDREQLAESRKLDYLIEQGEANLAELRERFEDAKRRVGTAGRQLLAEIDHRDRSKKALGELIERTVAERESVEALKADVAGRDKEVKRLQDEEEALRGFRVREIKGEGDRQYLTGLFVGGTHILVALDASASMLDRTIVQILRRRNMSKERQRAAPKWRRAQRIVEWICAQAPLESNFQIALYGEAARFPLGDDGWRSSTDPAALGDALEAIAEVVPAGGTSLEALMRAIAEMRPLPDNVFLVTDGLPTQSAAGARGRTVTARQRQRLFEDAAKLVPPQVTFNVIMLPLEGDALASAAYWVLAANSRGTYMSPSEDWP